MSENKEVLDDGWGDDGIEGFDDDDEFSKEVPYHRSGVVAASGPPTPAIYWALKKYLDILPHLPSSINAMLEAEHNSNPQKAWDLVRYYQERPELVRYTLEKEVPRMEYIWMDQDTGEPIHDDKPRIAQLLLEEARRHDSILPRCANQSLLADLLEFLSDSSHSDALIRRQFHMAAQTQRVQFVLEPAVGTVLVKAMLTLTLPHPTQGMISVATLHVSCQFAPHLPLWHYHLESIQPARKDGEWTRDELLQISYFLQELSPEEEEGFGDQGGDSLRDAFLQRTAMDVWNQLKNSSQSISTHFSLLSGDLLEQLRIEEEEAQAEALAEKQQRVRHLQQYKIAPSAQHLPPPQNQPHYRHHHQQQQHGRQQRQAAPEPSSERPQSILGGVFSRLAKSVAALPREDESMYDEWRQLQQQQQQHPQPGGGRAAPESERPGRPQPPPNLRNNNDHHLSHTRQQQVILPESHGGRPEHATTMAHPLEPHSNAPVSPDKHKPAPTTEPAGDNNARLSLPVKKLSASAGPSSFNEKSFQRCTDSQKQEPDKIYGKHAVYHFQEEGKMISSQEVAIEEENDENDGWGDEDLLVLDDEEEEDKNTEIRAFTEAIGMEDPLVLLPSTAKTLSKNDHVSHSKAPQPSHQSMPDQSHPKVDPYDVETAPGHNPPLDSPSANTSEETPSKPPDDIDNDDWAYDPETDIIPTRQRWRNPRPGPRQLSKIIAEHKRVTP